MIVINKYKSIDENQFNDLLKKYLIRDASFASAIDVNPSTISLKRHRGFSLSYSQAFAFYASYFLSENEISFLHEKMLEDGFIISEKKNDPN